MQWKSLSTGLKGDFFLINAMANLGVLPRFNHDNSHYPCRLGLSLEESLEDVKVCQSSEAPMPSKLAAIRFFSSFID